MNIAGFVIANYPHTRRKERKSVLCGPSPSTVQASPIGSPGKATAHMAQSAHVEGLMNWPDAVSNPMHQTRPSKKFSFGLKHIAVFFKRAVTVYYRQDNVVMDDRHNARDALRTCWQADEGRRRAVTQTPWGRQHADHYVFMPSQQSQCKAPHKLLQSSTFGHDAKNKNFHASPEGKCIRTPGSK